LAQDTTTPIFGPLEWNYFHTRVQNTLNDVEHRIRRLQIEIVSHPEKKAAQALEIEADINAIVEVKKKNIQIKHFYL